MKKLTIALITLLAVGTSGCAVTTAGVKKGDERNFARSINDVSAARTMKARMLRAHTFKLSRVDVEVAEGIAVLSGSVPSAEDRLEAERIAWSAPYIERVGNEIKVKGKQGLISNTQDGALNQAIRTRLIAEKGVKARNFNIEVHDGIVYLLGVARTTEELERAAYIASTTRGAREIVSYVKLAEPRVPAPELAQAPAPSVPAPSPVPYSAPQALPSAPIETPTPLPAPASRRALPDFVTPAPQAPEGGFSQPVPYSPPVPSPVSPPADIREGVEKMSQNRLQETFPPQETFPSDAELGKFRGGSAGEAVSVIESAPYYVDPETGAEIPVKF